jgi:hypothetical protein
MMNRGNLGYGIGNFPAIGSGSFYAGDWSGNAAPQPAWQGAAPVPAEAAATTPKAAPPVPYAQNWSALMEQLLANLRQPARYQGQTMTPQSPFPYFARGENLQLGFDPKAYLQQNPDVAVAVADGRFTSPYQHYQLHGLGEGRSPYAGAVNWGQRGMANMYRPRSFGMGLQQPNMGGMGGLPGLLAGRR